MAKKRSGCGIPFLFFLVLLGGVGWSAWWLYLSSQISQGLEQRAGMLRDAGWQVSYAPVRVDGYPFRVRVTLDDLSVIAPAGHGVRGDGIAAEAMAYSLDHWMVVAPDGLDLGRGPKGWTHVTGEALRASVSHLQSQPPRIVVEFLQPRFQAEAGAQPFPIASADRLIVNLIPQGPDRRQAGLLFQLTNARGRPGGPLERMAERRPFDLNAEAVVEEAPRLQGRTWRQALSGWATNGGSLSGIRVEATAGEDYARGQSERLAVDASGRLVGPLQIELRGGTAPLEGLAYAPGVDPRAAAAVRFGARLTSGLRGRTDLGFRFGEGRTHIGPITLGPAPKVY